jgi:methionine-gamma-lyase
MRINSAVIHAKKQKTKYSYGVINEPIFRSSTFVFDSVEQGGRRYAGKEVGYVYTRNGNPTLRYLEERLAYIEGSEDCLCTSSGMGAITSTI